MQEVRLVIVWLHILGLGTQGSPDQKHVTCVAAGVEIVVWGAHVWQIDCRLGVALEDFNLVEAGERVSSTMAKEVVLGTDPFPMCQGIQGSISDPVRVTVINVVATRVD